MPFPRVELCLVCEDYRRELFGKGTIVGLYGIAPDATILVRQFPATIDRLSFVLFTVPGQGGEYKLRPKIFDPDGGLVSDLKETGFATPPTKKIALSITVLSPTFQKEGEYKFELVADDVVAYQTKFAVRRGSDDVFALG
jgi:hypothetical protein